VGLIYAPPDKRRRDTDGMLSACKSYLDGIADHIGLDDSKFVFEKMYRTEPCRPGWVKVKIVPVASSPVDSRATEST
jgi:crossover junction endodeoxyribonuclease RusA